MGGELGGEVGGYWNTGSCSCVGPGLSEDCSTRDKTMTITHRELELSWSGRSHVKVGGARLLLLHRGELFLDISLKFLRLI